MKILRLTKRLFQYELRTKQWYINAFAIVLVTALMTLFYVYSERLNLAIKAESSHILGGDLVLVSPNPTQIVWENAAKNAGLKVASVLTLQTMAKANNQFQLINLQAVSNQYPVVKSTPLSIPENTILVEPRLMKLLNLTLNDYLQIGDSNFKISALLTPDVDSLSTGFNIAPRAMIKVQDLAKTNIVLPGSRVDYRLLFTGTEQQLQSYITWIKPRLLPGQRLLDINTQEFVLSSTVANISQVFQGVILLTLLLCVIAILVNAKEYLNEHINFVALWQTLGETKLNIILILSLQIIIMAVISAFIGVIIAIFLEYPIDYVIVTYTSRTLPSTGILTFLRGTLAGIVLLCLTVWMQIYSLATISPKHIFQKKIILSLKSFRYAFLLNMLAVILYLYLFINFNQFTLLFLSTVILSIGILLIATDSIISALRYLAQYSNGVIRRGIYFLVQHAETGSLQLSAFTLICVFASCILFMQKNLLTDFSSSWGKEKSNYFIYNISESDLPSLQTFLHENQLKSATFYPILRGRLIAINHIPLQQLRVDWNHNALRRELNLTSSSTYPDDNVIIAGKQTTQTQPMGLSIEESLAKALSAKLNDELTFQISDKQLTAKIDSIRTVKWSTLNPNFFIIFNPYAFNGFITPYLTSIYVEPNKQDLLLTLLKKFPSATLIDISSIITQIQQIIDYAALIITYLFVAVISAALLVVWSCLLASKAERHKTNQLLITLGASESYIIKSVFFQIFMMTLIIVLLSIPLTILIYKFGIAPLFIK